MRYLLLADFDLLIVIHCVVSCCVMCYVSVLV